MSIPLPDRTAVRPSRAPVHIDDPPFLGLLLALERYLRRRQSRQDLARLDDRLLRDVGMTRDEASGPWPDRPDQSRPERCRRVGYY
jgi:uncharacterized protein YjiS (DUF1127 family)